MDLYYSIYMQLFYNGNYPIYHTSYSYKHIYGFYYAIYILRPDIKN